jgi:ABC-type enterochelin transport system permease subunit
LNAPTKATDGELVQSWSSGSHQLGALVSMISFTLAGLFFLVFLANLRARLLAAEGGAGTLTTIVFSAGLLFGAALFAAATARGVISYAVKSPAAGEPLPGADLLRYLPQISYVVLGFCGLLSAALAIAVTSFLAFRTRVFGRLLAWLGVACAAGLIAANAILIGSARSPRCCSGQSPRASPFGGPARGAAPIRAAARPTMP